MEILVEVADLIRSNYLPVRSLQDADLHLSTGEIYEKMMNVYPDGKELTPARVAEVMNGLGFYLADFGEMRFEWIMKERSS